jgi:hypothetical protein
VTSAIRLRATSRTGAAFTKCFYNSSTIIPSSILPQANPDAPNSSKRGKIVEELWKNCRKILRALVLQAAGKNPRSILRLDERAQNPFYNFSTILPRCLPGEGPQNLSTILPQFFPDGSLP